MKEYSYIELDFPLQLANISGISQTLIKLQNTDMGLFAVVQRRNRSAGWNKSIGYHKCLSLFISLSISLSVNIHLNVKLLSDKHPGAS